MKKIRLDPDALTVETFATERDGETEQGTVHAYSAVPLGGCVTINCPGDTLGCEPVNPTFGTGEIYCVCVSMVNPTDTSDETG